MSRFPHVRPISRAARYQWRQDHPRRPWAEAAVGIVACIALAVVAFWMLPALAMVP